MEKLQISIEAYPDLKSDKALITAMEAYQDVESNISAARRFYNTSVADLNTAVETFPSSFMAPLANTEKMPFYEDADKDKIAKQIDVDSYLD